MFLHVALLSPPYSGLTYQALPTFPDAFWRPGLRLLVPLGRGQNNSARVAILLQANPVADLPKNIVCKPILRPLEEKPLLSPDLLYVASDLANYLGVEIGFVFKHILPVGLRTVKKKREATSTQICYLTVDPPWPIRPFAKLQKTILDYLYDHGSTGKTILLQTLGREYAQALTTLLKSGLIRLQNADNEESEIFHCGQKPQPDFILNSAQQTALDSIKDYLQQDKTLTCLLFGVTGSGKTAVYLELARYCLTLHKSVLLLAPEVALALKLYKDVRKTLPNIPVFLYHGYQSPSTREKIFCHLAQSSQPCLIVGTRSALFLPIPHLACIILDEEHDESYKQDESFCYQAKAVAWLRLSHVKGLLLLGSATPDIKTFYAVEQGRVKLASLPYRVGNAPLPPIELVQIAGKKGVGASLAPESVTALRETLARNEQAVILLNRRGYTPIIYCLHCNSALRCPQCEISLTYHKAREQLVCHYCNYTQPFPAPCPKCGNTDFLPIGEGTEQLAEKINALVEQPVLRLDRDSTRRKGRLEEILTSFDKQETSVLVGTQMLSKGHHFPKVTLVIVADADLGLNLPDYRSVERTFQMLIQSAGRAGRGNSGGRVLLQTRDLQHYCWDYVLKNDYIGFYKKELTLRQLRAYPPFVHLGLLRISYALTEEKGKEALAELSQILRQQAQQLKLKVLGPAPAPISLLKGHKRFQCLIKARDWPSVRKLYFYITSLPSARILKLQLDLDPLNML